MNPVRIDVFSDYICPFCYIGHGLIGQLERESGISVQVHWLGFEIHPETPKEGVDLAERFGGGERLEASHRALGGRAEVMGMAWHPSKRLANSHRALLLAEYARDRGAFAQVSERLFDAYFGRGEDLNDDNVLTAVAKAGGLDPEVALLNLDDESLEERLHQTLTMARRWGIDGTPTFVLNARLAVVGAQPYEALREAVERVQSEDSGE